MKFVVGEIIRIIKSCDGNCDSEKGKEECAKRWLGKRGKIIELRKSKRNMELNMQKEIGVGSKKAN